MTSSQGPRPPNDAGDIAARITSARGPLAIAELVRDEAGAAIDYRLLAVNGLYEQQTGKDAGALVGRLGSELFGPSGRLAEYARVAETLFPYRFDGFHPGLGRATRFTVVAAGADRIAFALEDVSEQVRMERALRESEERVRAIFEHAAIGIAMVDSPTGRFVRVNARYAEIAGRAVDEMLRCRWQDLTAPDKLAEDTAALADVLEGRTASYTKEKQYVHKDGSAVCVNLTVSRTWAAGEPPTFHVAVVEDITARKVAERALRDSEDRYRTLIENIDGVVFATDADGTVVFASGGVARYGWTPDDVIGRPLDPLIHPDDLAALKTNREARLAGAAPAPYDFRLVAADGHVHHVRSTAG